MTLRPAALVVACLLAVGLAGCIGTPAPTTSTSAPAFASDAEAYKAAEKVYRAYVDALNQVDLADPKTFEPVYALTTGDANAADRKSFSQMHADGWIVAGETRITLLQPEQQSAGKLGLAVCTNVKDVTLVDAAGVSMVSPDRSDVQRKLVVLETTSSGLRISDFFARSDGPTCDG